jgi:hypothetical protein
MVQQVEDDFIDETPVFIGVLASLWWFLFYEIYQTLRSKFHKDGFL